jgi:hypothetical protein
MLAPIAVMVPTTGKTGEGFISGGLGKRRPEGRNEPTGRRTFAIDFRHSAARLTGGRLGEPHLDRSIVRVVNIGVRQLCLERSRSRKPQYVDAEILGDTKYGPHALSCEVKIETQPLFA